MCTDCAVKWLEEHNDNRDPFFIFIWSNGTHDPYMPRASKFSSDSQDHGINGSLTSLRDANPESADRVQNLYDDTIRHADEQLGVLVENLKKMGIYEDTVIIFTADHGEVLSEHGRLEHTYSPIRRCATRLSSDLCRSHTLFESGAHVGHLQTLPYDEVLHVPLIIKPARRYSGGETREGLVETIDLMPTIGDLAGISIDTQGASLLPLFEKDRSFKQYVYSDTATSRGISRSRSVRSSDHKLIQTDWDLSGLNNWHTLEPNKMLLSIWRKVLTKTPHLFNLSDESVDISRPKSEIFASYERELEEWLKRCRDGVLNPETIKLDKDTEEQLRDLGYM